MWRRCSSIAVRAPATRRTRPRRGGGAAAGVEPDASVPRNNAEAVRARSAVAPRALTKTYAEAAKNARQRRSFSGERGAGTSFQRAPRPSASLAWQLELSVGRGSGWEAGAGRRGRDKSENSSQLPDVRHSVRSLSESVPRVSCPRLDLLLPDTRACLTPGRYPGLDLGACEVSQAEEGEGGA